MEDIEKFQNLVNNSVLTEEQKNKFIELWEYLSDEGKKKLLEAFIK